LYFYSLSVDFMDIMAYLDNIYVNKKTDGNKTTPSLSLAINLIYQQAIKQFLFQNFFTIVMQHFLKSKIIQLKYYENTEILTMRIINVNK
jgi:hypothetical protein